MLLLIIGIIHLETENWRRHMKMQKKKTSFFFLLGQLCKYALVDSEMIVYVVHMCVYVCF